MDQNEDGHISIRKNKLNQAIPSTIRGIEEERLNTNHLNTNHTRDKRKARANLKSQQNHRTKP